MNTTDHRDCPECDHPLTPEGRCPACNKRPKVPPPRFRHAHWQIPIGVGEPPQNVAIRRRYEVPELQNQGYLTESEVKAWLRKNISTDASDVGALLEILMQSQQVEKAEIKPTEWDIYLAEQAQRRAEIRVSEGCFFRLIDSTKTTLKVIGLVKVLALPFGWAVVPKLFGGIYGVRKIFDLLVILKGDDKIVFEELYNAITKLSLTGKSTPTLTQSSVLPTVVPSTAQLVERLKDTMPEDRVRDALSRLQAKSVIKLSKKGWKIKI
jgi:hypothetical protein